MKEPSKKEQTEELLKIISQLSAITGRTRQLFFHGRTVSDNGLAKQLSGIIEELAFTTVMEEEQLRGRNARERKPILIHLSILTHLHIVSRSMMALVKELKKQAKAGPPICSEAVAQSDNLMTQQEMILCTIEEAIRSGEIVHLRTICRACSSLDRYCRRCATAHEQRVAKGLCPHDSALIFLTILDLLRSLVHHEQETIKLLLRWQTLTQRLAA